MSKRLQVILDDKEMEEVRRSARMERVTVAEWVRAALREFRRSRPQGDADRKIQTIRAAVRHELPTADIAVMLKEIESGSLQG